MTLSKNDITGDSQKTKASNEAFRQGWDRIFGKDYIKSLDSPENVLETDQVLSDDVASDKEK